MSMANFVLMRTILQSLSLQKSTFTQKPRDQPYFQTYQKTQTNTSQRFRFTSTMGKWVAMVKWQGLGPVIKSVEAGIYFIGKSTRTLTTNKHSSRCNFGKDLKGKYFQAQLNRWILGLGNLILIMGWWLEVDSVEHSQHRWLRSLKESFIRFGF